MQRVVNGLLAAVLLIAIGTFVGVARTDAFVIWCWDDPMIAVDGVRFDLAAAVGSELGTRDVQRNVQVAHFIVHVQKGARVERLGRTQANFAETLQVVFDGAAGTIRVEVKFQARSNLPAALVIKKNGVQVTQDTNGTADGVPAWMGTTSGGVFGPTLTLK